MEYSALRLETLALHVVLKAGLPTHQLGPVNQTVTRDSSFTLFCQFTARDKARVAWLKEGIPIEFSDNDRYYLTDGYNLQIKGIILLYKYSQSLTADSLSTLFILT